MSMIDKNLEDVIKDVQKTQMCVYEVLATNYIYDCIKKLKEIDEENNREDKARSVSLFVCGCPLIVITLSKAKNINFRYYEKNLIGEEDKNKEKTASFILTMIKGNSVPIIELVQEPIEIMHYIEDFLIKEKHNNYRELLELYEKIQEDIEKNNTSQ